MCCIKTPFIKVNLPKNFRMKFTAAVKEKFAHANEAAGNYQSVNNIGSSSTPKTACPTPKRTIFWVRILEQFCRVKLVLAFVKPVETVRVIFSLFCDRSVRKWLESELLFTFDCCACVLKNQNIVAIWKIALETLWWK